MPPCSPRPTARPGRRDPSADHWTASSATAHTEAWIWQSSPGPRFPGSDPWSKYAPFCHSRENGNPVISYSLSYLDSRLRGNDGLFTRTSRYGLPKIGKTGTAPPFSFGKRAQSLIFPSEDKAPLSRLPKGEPVEGIRKFVQVWIIMKRCCLYHRQAVAAKIIRGFPLSRQPGSCLQ